MINGLQDVIDNPCYNAKYCWRSKDELISNILQWTPTSRHTNSIQPAKAYIHQLCADTRCHLEDLSKAMADWDSW